MKENLTKAMKARFYYQVIYAIIEDRCTSALKHAGVKYLDSIRSEIKLVEKINKMKGHPSFTTPFVRQRISLELLDDITEWKRQR